MLRARCSRIEFSVLTLVTLVSRMAFGQAVAVEVPRPLAPGKQVVLLWPPEKLVVRGTDLAEKLTMRKNVPDEVQAVENIHNPSIEVWPAPDDKRTGIGVIVAGGGGNRRIVISSEGHEPARWLNSQGITAFVLRYRIQPYEAGVEGQADTLRAMQMVRAHAKAWGVDPDKIGILGFSAGGAQGARATVNYRPGNPDAVDPLDRVSSRPDFSILIYPGWKPWDFSKIPSDAPPTFLVCPGIGDASHARQTVEFYNALFEAKIPVEMHIYGKGVHGGGMSSRNGIPFGKWPLRCIEWMRDDLGILPQPTGEPGH
ncbi:alpha/beta hydrolase [Planctomicrobium sp. SH664]|uniref:alpha/beta hydrolase n=1 Tax=Planctomicrobium sp. SH664 TaxID=3448125 RepID=UPI003F5C762D